MLLIGYAIAAVIVIVLLIVFNLRAASKRSKAIKEETIPPAEDTVSPIREEAMTQHADKDAVSTTEGRHREIPARSGKKDQSYRNALRDLRAGKEQLTKAPERSKDTEKMPDSDYRNAMRNFQAGKDKDKG
ncbi:hypothetical protein [Paenibacillus sp. sgz302251]|uniref:hypothetical protein n=1 Tax=Paenibacillus sp. sgz302251 TaxID=3414493 RepID=UPI003C7A4E2A